MRRVVRIITALMVLVLLAGGGWWWWGAPKECPPPTGMAPDPAVSLDPAKEYRLQYWDYRWPLHLTDAGTFETYTQELLAAFREDYPNVTVEYRLLDFADGPAELARALAAGEAPDVYASFNEPGPPGMEWRVAAGPYFTEAEREGLLPLAAAAVSVEEMAAWPRWLDTPLWYGHRALLTQAGVDPEDIAANGWTWDEFAQVAARAGKGSHSLLFNPAASVSLVSLLANSPTGQADAAVGGPVWSAPALTEVLSWIGALRDAGSGGANAKMDALILPLYWEGRVMTAAGLGPWFPSWVIQSGKAGVSSIPVPLPVPHAAGTEGVFPITAGTITVFRQGEYRGDDHTRAAMELARFLSRQHSSYLARRLGFIPVWPEDLADWLAALPTGDLGRQLYARALSAGVILPPGSYPDALGGQAAKVDAALSAWWARKAGTQATAEAILMAMGWANELEP